VKTINPGKPTRAGKPRKPRKSDRASATENAPEAPAPEKCALCGDPAEIVIGLGPFKVPQRICRRCARVGAKIANMIGAFLK
jgi:hypothetical protein